MENLDTVILEGKSKEEIKNLQADYLIPLFGLSQSSARLLTSGCSIDKNALEGYGDYLQSLSESTAIGDIKLLTQ